MTVRLKHTMNSQACYFQRPFIQVFHLQAAFLAIQRHLGVFLAFLNVDVPHDGVNVAFAVAYDTDGRFSTLRWRIAAGEDRVGGRRDGEASFSCRW